MNLIKTLTARYSKKELAVIVLDRFNDESDEEVLAHVDVSLKWARHQQAIKRLRGVALSQKPLFCKFVADAYEKQRKAVRRLLDIQAKEASARWGDNGKK